MREEINCTDGLDNMVVHEGNVTCRRCGEIIPPARLKAMPNAIYCVDCQTEIEQKQKG